MAEIWQSHGEPAYRAVEVDVTCGYAQRERAVIALGGGTLMQPGARQAVESAEPALRVYLRCEPTALVKRIHEDANSAATRPNLTKFGGGLEEIEAMLTEREPVYRAVADLEINVSQVGVEQVADQIASALEWSA